MAFSIYKPGQGYWTRMLTAIGAGIVVMSTVGWLWYELGNTSFSVHREHVGGLGTVGEAGDASDPLKAFGISLADAEIGGNSLRIESVASESRAIQAGFSRDDVVAAVNSTVVTDRATLAKALEALESTGTLKVTVDRSESIVLYIQAGVAVVVILIAGMVLWWIMNRPRSVDFMIATEAEMRKVNWPSRREIRGSTMVVVCGTIIMAVFLWSINLVFGFLFTEIKILER